MQAPRGGLLLKAVEVDLVLVGPQGYRGLFDDTGAPHWDESSVYPRDIHASAQGIVTFSQLGDSAHAGRILRWTVENLSDGDGQFYHEQRRFYTKRITFMRWCQAWMAHALAVYGVCLDDVSPTSDRIRPSAPDSAGHT